VSQLWTFPGGVHPPDHKALSCNAPIRDVPLPEALWIPLQQHVGSPATPLVQPGDRVLRGQCLADAISSLSLPIHAPVAGTVEAIEMQPMLHPSGLEDLAIRLVPDKADARNQWITRAPMADFRECSPSEILTRLRNHGIAGMGGAGFASHIKLRSGLSRQSLTLVINGAECEPYITADDRLMREEASRIVQGTEVMAWLLRAERKLIAIEDNKPEAIATMQEATAHTEIEVVVIPTKYPSGGEKQLVQILTGREIPHRGLPADVGVICQNVATAHAVAGAILADEPQTERIVTVTGQAVVNPGNYRVAMGTPVRHLLEFAGVKDMSQLIIGGPMMGFAQHSLEAPVTKTTQCLLAAAAGELADPADSRACIRCGDCAVACPMSLLPQQLYWHSRAGELEKARDLDLFDCIECGACAYVCPSDIPLVHYYRQAKGELRKQDAEAFEAAHSRRRFEARQQRTAREAEEREQRRRARLERLAARTEVQTSQASEADTPKAESAASVSKSAMVQEILARKQAGKTAHPATGQNTSFSGTTPADLPKARAKLAKMQKMLEETRQRGGDVQKLEQSVALWQQRVDEALDAEKNSGSDASQQESSP